MRILLLSAYDAHSHRRWREGLVAAFPEWHWTVLTQPPRNFSWRVRGNSLGWAFTERDTLQQPYDVLIATSMTDLSALKGMVPALASVPSLVYCHENQFAYPDRRERVRNEPKITSLYAMVSADCVLFNSAYNRDSCLAGAQALLQKMPDAVPGGVIESIADKSRVLPVPIEDHWYEQTTRRMDATRPLTIVWNHRWEYDKAPERLFAALRGLHDAGVDFRVHVIGHRFREQPAVFEASRSWLAPHIGEWGTVADDADYRRVLCGSHVVLSTALHEFQGLAVLEAVACGCLPLVPDRLAYPEFFPAACRYPSHSQDAGREAAALAERLVRLAGQYERGVLPAAPPVTGLGWPVLAERYGEVMAAAAGRW
jgi:glycosyltransferase involved in cell wall biosynthesis